ncbi:hypothetical protein EV360DRAFT_67525 [Lentinula raphanica]|nr:hypothetical protein EV360DRAFT_67525 [Lentinula raphanica]
MSFFVKLAISLFSLQVLTAEAVLSAEPQIRDIGALCGFEPGMVLQESFVAARRSRSTARLMVCVPKAVACARSSDLEFGPWMYRKNMGSDLILLCVSQPVFVLNLKGDCLVNHTSSGSIRVVVSILQILLFALTRIVANESQGIKGKENQVTISTTVLVTALLHTFVGTVAAIPSEPLIIYCKGPGDVTSVLTVTFVATTQIWLSSLLRLEIEDNDEIVSDLNLHADADGTERLRGFACIGLKLEVSKLKKEFHASSRKAPASSSSSFTQTPLNPHEANSQSNQNTESAEDIYYEKLAFNHDISVHYHKLCSEAYRNRFKMAQGIADMALIHDILNTNTSSAPDCKVEGKIMKPEIPKRNTSLYSSDNPLIHSTPATPLDLLTAHEETQVPHPLKTPAKKPCLKRTPAHGNPQMLSSTSNAPNSQATSVVTIISDDEEEDEDITISEPVKKPMAEKPDMLKELNDCRRKLSAALGRLPDEILPMRTLKQLSTQSPCDYKEFQAILADTSDIPERNTNERKAYVAHKWREIGSDFFQICIQYRLKEQISKASETYERKGVSGKTVTFRKIIATHGHSSAKPIDLRQFSFSGNP